MGVTQGAGLSLQWFRNQLAPGVAYDDLTAEAAETPAGAEGLFWQPYLMGERTPHLDATARAGWAGLTAKHTRGHMVRAIIEGVCYSQKDGLDIIEGMGVPVKSVRVSGGGANSAFWKQMLADILNKRVVTLEHVRKARPMGRRCWPAPAQEHSAPSRRPARPQSAKWSPWNRAPSRRRRSPALTRFTSRYIRR